MAQRPIVLISLRDSAAAERLASALEAEGDFLITLEAVSDGAEILIAEGQSLGELRITTVHDGDGFAVLPVDADAALIASAVRLVAAGYSVSRLPIKENAAHFGPGDAELDEEGAPPPVLSVRELEVLALLADGAQNKVIARALDISVHTAKFHVASLLTKLGAINRTDAIVIAMREGLVPL